MSQQGLRQASIRAVTGSAETYEGDWHRLFDLAGVSSGATSGVTGIYSPLTYDERLLRWINLKLGVTYINLPEAMQALANYVGAYNFSSIGTFDASTSGSAGSPMGLLFLITKAA